MILGSNLNMKINLVVFFVRCVFGSINSCRLAISLVLFIQHISRKAELVDTFRVNFVDPALIKENEENNIVAEYAQPMQRRHFDDEGEKVVDNGVQELVRHHAPWHVRHRFELVVAQATEQVHFLKKINTRWSIRHVLILLPFA